LRQGERWRKSLALDGFGQSIGADGSDAKASTRASQSHHMPGSNSVAECWALRGFRAQAWSGGSDNFRFPDSTGQLGPSPIYDDASLNTNEMALQGEGYLPFSANARASALRSSRPEAPVFPYLPNSDGNHHARYGNSAILDGGDSLRLNVRQAKSQSTVGEL